MEKSQFYKYATWGLALLNISLLAFFFLTKPNHHRGERLREKVPKLLKLDDQQNANFQTSAKEHRRRMDALQDKQKELLNPYFSLLLDKSTRINQDSLLNQIQGLEAQKIKVTYNHLEEVKSFLNKDQYADYELFVDKALKTILGNRKKEGRKPKD